ncbi:hypothetical protein H0H92_008264 [Tricholoma furcatifolium]|nr:hypothetical protein H0H92_008264 [Tricholoma furcatifolium]
MGTPSLPPELLLKIFTIISDETNWEDLSVDGLMSPGVFPAAIASVSRTWREVMSMVRPPQARVIIFADAPRCLEFARLQLQWSQRFKSPIDLVVSFPYHRFSNEEGILARKILDIVRPHFSRCRIIIFNVTYTTSLPRLAVDFPDVAPHLKRLHLLAKIPNGMHGFMRGPSPSLFPFPRTTLIEIDGCNFVDIAKTPKLPVADGKQWLEYLTMHLDKSILPQLRVSHYKVENAAPFVMNNVLPVLNRLGTIELKNLEFDADLDAVQDEGDLASLTISLSGLEAELTALMLLHRDLEVVTLDRCNLSEITSFDSFPAASLELSNIEYKGNKDDLRALLRLWDGVELHIVNCPEFDDSVISVFTESIDVDADSDLVTMPCERLQTILIERCHSFSIAALRQMVDTRNEFCAAWHRNGRDPELYPQLQYTCRP